MWKLQACFRTPTFQGQPNPDGKPQTQPYIISCLNIPLHLQICDAGWHTFIERSICKRPRWVLRFNMNMINHVEDQQVLTLKYSSFSGKRDWTTFLQANVNPLRFGIT